MSQYLDHPTRNTSSAPTTANQLGKCLEPTKKIIKKLPLDRHSTRKVSQSLEEMIFKQRPQKDIQLGECKKHSKFDLNIKHYPLKLIELLN